MELSRIAMETYSEPISAWTIDSTAFWFGSAEGGTRTRQFLFESTFVKVLSGYQRLENFL